MTFEKHILKRVFGFEGMMDFRVSIFFPAVSVILLFQLVGYSQSKSTFYKQDVIEEAKKQLLSLSSSSGVLGEFCQKNSIRGKFEVDLTLYEKGKVLTVFMVSSEAESIKEQNALKNKLTQLQFSNIKIPKKERVKFRTTLTF